MDGADGAGGANGADGVGGADGADADEARAKAATLLGAALSVREARGAATDAVLQHAEARALRESHADAWGRGAAMSTEEAVALGAAEVQGVEPAAEERPAKAPRRSRFSAAPPTAS